MSLGCQHGCNDGVKSGHGDFLRAKVRFFASFREKLKNLQGRSLLASLERLNAEAFRSLLVEFVTEKQQLQVGETARLFLKTRQAGPALLTVEGAELFLARPFQAKKGAQILEFPIEAKLAPGVTASVALLEDGRSVSESVELTVPDEAHRLDLKIEATQPKYRPGETAHLKLAATNSQGEPVDATASLAVVDEALLALSGDQVPAIHKFFFAPGENRVQTYVMQPRRPEVAGPVSCPLPRHSRRAPWT